MLGELGRFMKFIQYSLVGKVIRQCYTNSISEFSSYPLGQKVRVTTSDRKEYVGFWSAPYNPAVVKTVELLRYNLDEGTGMLRSHDLNGDTIIFVPVAPIVKIEAIMHSNPRWGTRPTNKFEFAKTVKFDPKTDPFKNWPRK